MISERAVYLDNNATTPPDDIVSRAMRPWLATHFGNASSVEHPWGWDAAEAVEEARGRVAEAAHGTSSDVVFVSGATEALNTVVRAYVGLSDWSRKTVVTCVTEHDAVLTSAKYLCEKTAVRLQLLSVDRSGCLRLDELRAAVDTKAGALVAIMAANNEIGTIHPMREVSDVVHSAKGLFLCDTTQAFGRLPVDVRADGLDFATVSAHKVHGPKGAGALIRVKTGANDLEPLILGGGQERGLRGGTVNVPGIVGLGAACRLAQEQLDEDMKRMGSLRDRLEEGIASQLPNTWVNGDRANRLCNTTNIGFTGVDARTLIRDMHDIAVSTRSACSSANSGPSHVLKAIGLSDEDAYSCIRFSLGRFTTEEEIDYAIDKVVATSHQLRRNKSVRM